MFHFQDQMGLCAFSLCGQTTRRKNIHTPGSIGWIILLTVILFLSVCTERNVCSQSKEVTNSRRRMCLWQKYLSVECFCEATTHLNE